MAINVGTAMKLYATVRDVESQALVDPTSLTLFINKPDTTTVTEIWPTGNIVRTSVGQFYYVVTLDQAGQWNRQWEAEGSANVTSDGAVIEVESSIFISG